MNIAFFLERIEETLPPGKPQTGMQLAEYRRKLERFTGSQLDSLYEAVIDHCKFWPKLADIHEQATNLGFLATQRQDIPHAWKPTDCLRCGGAGLVAGFWSQEFELGEQGKTQILRLHYLMPYHASSEYATRRDHDDIRAAYRCDCPAGEPKTLPQGVMRWSTEISEVIRRG